MEVKNIKNKIKMRYFFLVGSIFFLMLSLVGSAHATTINQFNNSLTTENLTFTGNQNIIRYFNISRYASFSGGYITVNGIGIYNCDASANNLTLIGGITYLSSYPTNYIYNIVNLTGGSTLAVSSSTNAGLNISACQIYIDSTSKIEVSGIGSSGGFGAFDDDSSIVWLAGNDGAGSGYGHRGFAGYLSSNCKTGGVYACADGGGGAGAYQQGGSSNPIQTNSVSSGVGGSSWGNNADKNIYFGSGGGGGGGSAYCAGSCSEAFTAGHGGNGGGGVSLTAQIINISGTINANGANGARCGSCGGNVTFQACACGGGGGGSGGTILLIGSNINISSATLSAKGGNGGFGLSYNFSHPAIGLGGGGGTGGWIKIFYNNLYNTSTVVNVSAGYGGSNAGISGSSDSGSSGSIFNLLTILLNFPLNLYLEIGTPDSVREWNYTNLFNTTVITNNFASVLNRTLNSTGSYNCPEGNLNGTYCTIPFLFHSDTIGILNYSILNITYNLPSPSIQLNLPNNSAIINNTSNVSFNFTAIDDFNATFSCSIYLDNVLNQTNSSTVNNTLTNFLINGINKGSHSWYINCNDGLSSNVSETRYFTIQHAINNISTNPSTAKIFNNFNILVNVTNLADTTANVTIKFPNNTITNYTTSSSGGLLITQNFTATNGTYYINATTDDGSAKSYNFTVTDNYLYLPDSYTSITQAGLNFSILTSIFEDTNENLSHTYGCAVNDGSPTNFSCVIPENPYYIINNGTMILNITTNATTPDGSYSGNITIKRDIDNLTKVIPLSLELLTNYGQPYIINATAWTLSMYDNDTASTNYLVNNTGTYNLTNCIPTITGEFVNQSWYSLNLNPTIAIGQTRNLTITYAYPTARTDPYRGNLQVSCNATVGGVINTLASSNQPYFAVLVVSPLVPLPPAPSGGGSNPPSSTACGESIIINPSTIILTPSTQAVVFTITNGNLFQVSPSYELKAPSSGTDGSGLLLITGTGAPILPTDSKQLTVSLSPNAQITEESRATLTITNAKCMPIDVPILITTSAFNLPPSINNLLSQGNDFISTSVVTLWGIEFTYGHFVLIGFAIVVAIAAATSATISARKKRY